jgi:hypothetical protein
LRLVRSRLRLVRSRLRLVRSRLRPLGRLRSLIKQ